MAAETIKAEGLVQWVRELDPGGRRTILGITGPPGAGKSTVAAMLSATFSAPIVAMDGFHLAHHLLEEAGWIERKGAPHTFDAHGFVALLRRLRRPEGDTVFAPQYDRRAKNPIGSAVRIDRDDRLILVEGNYLLLDDKPWDQIAPILDRCVYVELDPQTRVDRLIRRHIEYGKDPEAARSFVMRSDEANAEIVVACRDRADLVVEGV